MTFFTPEDLVSYLYNEASAEKATAIEVALQNDWSLREKLQVLRDSINDLDHQQIFSPRTEVILRVMNYVRQMETASVE